LTCTLWPRHVQALTGRRVSAWLHWLSEYEKRASRSGGLLCRGTRARRYLEEALWERIEGKCTVEARLRGVNAVRGEPQGL
jgi:hypothetical protein